MRFTVTFLAVYFAGFLMPVLADDPFPFDQPTMLSLIAIESDVQQELELSAEEKTSITKVFEGSSKKRVSNNECEKKLSAILPANKLERLRQIAWQIRRDEALRSDAVATGVDMTPGQRQEIERRWEASQETLVKDLRRLRFKTAKDRDGYIWKHIHKTADTMLEVLDDGQRNRFTQLMGKPFKSSLE